MDFNDTPDEALFRTEVRQWLENNASTYRQPLPKDLPEHEFVAHVRSWQRKKAQAGYAAIRWPREHGGLDGTPMQEVIFGEEEGHYHVPVGPVVYIGTNLAIPSIRGHGTAEQIERYTRPTLFGDYLWCQLFSEPAAGSDLAALRTKAVRDGDDWVITGQKVWTSWAHVADYGILLARTDSEVAKHKGLTFFVVDMKSPGIEVRPIRQISGDSEFNEVFLTEVRIPDANRIGAVGTGWQVTMTTLMNERIGVGGESQALPSVHDLLERLAQASSAGHAEPTAYAQRIASLYAQEQGLKYFRCRQLTQLSRGETPSPLGAMGKLVYANMLQDLSALALELDGPSGIIDDESSDPIRSKFQHGYFWASALRIAGGADEILRNQIGERVLQLPPEPRADKDVPFSQLTQG